MVAFRPFLEMERAELAGLGGDPKTRGARLAEARRLFAAMGASGHVERLAREIVP